jgi:NitT/TauT family transport system ATP-binding protein
MEFKSPPMAFVQLENVTKSFVSPRTGRLSIAVQRFNLNIAEGEFFCLLGPSGCGKSTILSMLAGFESATQGQILLDGKPVVGPSRDRGVVFQGDDSLYPWLNALENIEFGLRMCGVPKPERQERAQKALKLVGLTGQHEKFPTELSGGMKQRIQIARALVNEPKMLLMDEPFGALDAQTRHVMQTELRKIWLATRSTVVFITHDVDEAILLGSRVGVMSAGPGGTLRDVVEIDLKGERDRLDPAYMRYFAEVHRMIREEVAKSTMGAAA